MNCSNHKRRWNRNEGGCCCLANTQKKKKKEQAETDILSNAATIQPLPHGHLSLKQKTPLFRQLIGIKGRNVVEKRKETQKRTESGAKGPGRTQHMQILACTFFFFFAPSHKVPVAET